MARNQKTFTKTEKEILTFIYNGYLDINRLANVMFVTPSTMKTHLWHVKKKLGCKTMAELVYKVIKFDRQKGDYMNGKLIAELGNVFEKYGYNLTAVDTKEKEVNIKIEENNGQNN